MCTKLIQSLIKKEDALISKELQILNFILKYKSIEFDESIFNKVLQGTDPRRQAKSLFWISLKVQKGVSIINMLDQSESTVSCLGICKALLMRGENIGFKRTISEFRKNHGN